jgi:hypothetical protein
VSSGQSSVISYAYNGLGDRLQETANGSTTTFSMDLNTGLTQALSDGTYTYLYGNDRIAQVDTGGTHWWNKNNPQSYWYYPTSQNKPYVGKVAGMWKVMSQKTSALAILPLQTS